MQKNFEDFISSYEQNLDNPEWLSTTIVKLSAILYTHNTQMAQAEFSESQAMVRLLEESREGKKMAVSEAEKRAQVETNNHYHEMKVQAEAIIETINSIKKRLEVLQWEHRSTKY